MIRRRLAIESVRGLRRYKIRSTFVALGTLVGIALVTLVLSLNQGVQRKIGATIRQIFGGDGILVGARGTSLLGGPRPDAARLTIDDIAAVADTVPGIAAWDPQQARPSAAVKAGRAPPRSASSASPSVRRASGIGRRSAAGSSTRTRSARPPASR